MVEVPSRSRASASADGPPSARISTVPREWRGLLGVAGADGPPSARISTRPVYPVLRADRLHPAPTVHRRRGSQQPGRDEPGPGPAQPAPTVHRRRGSQLLPWLAAHVPVRQRRRSTVGEDLNTCPTPSATAPRTQRRRSTVGEDLNSYTDDPLYPGVVQRRRSTVGEDLNRAPHAVGVVHLAASADRPPSARISTRPGTVPAAQPPCQRRRSTVGEDLNIAACAKVAGVLETASAGGPPSARISTGSAAPGQRRPASAGGPPSARISTDSARERRPGAQPASAGGPPSARI